MNFVKLLSILNNQIQKKTSLEDGICEIEKYLEEQHEITFRHIINETEIILDFQNKLSSLFNKFPVQSNIKSIYFGLLEYIKKDNLESYGIQLSGSLSTPDEDEEWACDTDYLSNDFTIFLSDFEKIDKYRQAGNLNDEAEYLIFNGILNLLVINSESFLKQQLLINKNELWLGTGFLDGDCFIIGKIENE